MSKVVRERLQKTIQCLEEATSVIGETCANTPEAHLIVELLTDTQNLAIAFGTRVEQLKGLGTRTVEELERYCECLFHVNESMGAADQHEVIRDLATQMEQVRGAFEDDFPDKKEIVFLPYKASMWDSLESVWKAADADPECEAYVVPIPYYDRQPDFSFGDIHYEGESFPEDVPITSYEAYKIQERRPDVIYIHNPYDEGNYVTSVDPRFYSDELKKYTRCLVYIPYFVAGYYANEQAAVRNIPRCINNVDICVLQSNTQKKLFGISKQITDKMIVLGSPKMDRIISLNEEAIGCEIKEKICGRKTILVNSSISRILNDPQWFTKIERLIELFEQRTDLFMIWRPHPLLFTTINAMLPDKKSEMNEVINRVNKLENAYIDRSPSADCSIVASDGMISDYSSLVLQYTATGKPVLLTVGSSTYREKRLVCGDYFSNYFEMDGDTEEAFFEIISSENDYKREERMKYFRESIENTDGTCGIKIHTYVNKFLGEKYGI